MLHSGSFNNNNEENKDDNPNWHQINLGHHYSVGENSEACTHSVIEFSESSSDSNLSGISNWTKGRSR
jgi:hypothetical protein